MYLCHESKQIERLNYLIMSDNKHALLRYETIDRCLGNTRKVYHVQELLDECNEAIYERYGEGGIQKRQLYDDLNYMIEYYDAPIVRERDGHRDGVRALRRHVHVARPALVVGVAVEREDRALRARDAVAAVVPAAAAVGRMDSRNVRRGAVRVRMEMQADHLHARRQDRLHDCVRGKEKDRVRRRGDGRDVSVRVVPARRGVHVGVPIAPDEHVPGRGRQSEQGNRGRWPQAAKPPCAAGRLEG